MRSMPTTWSLMVSRLDPTYVVLSFGLPHSLARCVHERVTLSLSLSVSLGLSLLSLPLSVKQSLVCHCMTLYLCCLMLLGRLYRSSGRAIKVSDTWRCNACTLRPPASVS